MLFSSLTFLHVFLPSILALYFLSPVRMRNYVLLVASIIFYAWGEPLYLAMMLFTVIVNYVGALLIEKSQTSVLKKTALFGTISVDLGFLFYFKYFNFFLENLNKIDFFDFPFIEVIMPIGISFYTFQALSYLIDVYRGEVAAQHNFYKLALYISLFPQLVAGPIVKYHDVYEEINSRKETFERFMYGIRRFVMGLAKKVLLANTLGAVVDTIYALPVSEISVSAAWLGAIAYALQLYFDFSGYSDMAIGLGHMFGFKFLENFNYPYLSRSVSEFWRRWHISLSTWFKQYLYIPLGGNRISKGRTYINLFIVFLVTGFWHGASWSFIIWGMWNGVLVCAERFFGLNKDPCGKLSSFLRLCYANFVFLAGWVLFRSDTLTYAIDYLKVMFGIMQTSPDNNGALFYADNLFTAAFVMGIPTAMGAFAKIWDWALKTKFRNMLFNVWLLFLYGLTFLSLAGSTYNPFIYFRF